ncbi:MAG: hypothetical protein AB7G40_18320 [Hyphomonadaceae bacterium]
MRRVRDIASEGGAHSLAARSEWDAYFDAAYVDLSQELHLAQLYLDRLSRRARGALATRIIVDADTRTERAPALIVPKLLAVIDAISACARSGRTIELEAWRDLGFLQIRLSAIAARLHASDVANHPVVLWASTRLERFYGEAAAIVCHQAAERVDIVVVIPLDAEPSDAQRKGGAVLPFAPRRR